MSRTTEKFTYTDGQYFCNICDEPHEGEELAEDCYDACLDDIKMSERYPDGDGYDNGESKYPLPEWCSTNACEDPRCHRCFPRPECKKHEKCRNA